MIDDGVNGEGDHFVGINEMVSILLSLKKCLQWQMRGKNSLKG